MIRASRSQERASKYARRTRLLLPVPRIFLFRTSYGERMTRKRKAITAAELVMTRHRLGWSKARMAQELSLSPSVVDALESGSSPVPWEVAWALRARLMAEQQRVLDGSGLGECPRAEALDAAFRAAYQGHDEAAGYRAADALLAHQRRCHLCRARAAYARAHGASEPGLSLPWSVRVIGWGDVMADRLPRILRPPADVRGEYRRMSLFAALLLSLSSAGAIAAGRGDRLVRALAGQAHDLDTGTWLALLACLVPALFAGCWLAGTAWDLTHRIRDRFAGYVMRGAAVPAALYGTAAALTRLVVTGGTLDIYDYRGDVLTGVVIGSLSGAVLWIVHHGTDDPPAAGAGDGS
jgi:DNA-binding XRE family transcriptional regulator